MSNFETLFKASNPIDARFLNLVDLDRMFAMSPNAIIVNRIPSTSPNYLKQRNKYIFSREGVLSFVPHCDCGRLSAELNRGLTCEECYTECRDDFSPTEELEHNAWLSVPQTIPGVLHPIAYVVLTTWLSRKGSSNYIDVILDKTCELPPELEGFVKGRGYDYFYNNFDVLMDHFCHYFEYVDRRSKPKRDNVPFIRQFIKSYRDVMFCTKLPIMAAVLNSITSSDGTTEGKKYVDPSTTIILDAIADLQHIEETTIHTRPNTIPAIMNRVYKSYIEYIMNIAKSKLSIKEGLIRKHILGTRLHLTFRNVVGPHNGCYDELYIPWSTAVNLLKLHIIGRLVVKYDMLIGEAVSRHVTALLCYDELIDKIMKDLISECNPEFKGLPVAFVRNPTLRRGAMQLLYITKIKTDVEDETINIGTPILKAPNVDFDGDEMHGILFVETETAKAFEVMHPSQRIVSSNDCSISDDISLPKQSFAVLNHMLQSTD